MFCNNCGTELEDGIMFCPNCGMKAAPDNAEIDDDDKTVILSEEDSRTMDGMQNEADTVETVEISPTGVVETGTAVVVPEAAEQKKFCPNCGTANGLNDLFCQECGMFFGNAAEKMGGGNTVAKTRKGGNVWKIILAVIVLICVIGIGGVFVSRLSGSPKKTEWKQDFVLYLKDNELTMAQKNKYAPLVIGDRMFDDKDAITNGYHYAYGLISYSPDHKYVYYPQKADENGCDLYRKKLGSEKAEEVKIDSQIVEYEVISNDMLVYIKNSTDRKLYLYNKGESQKLASDVWGMRVSADGKYVLWRSDDKLYVQATNLKSDKVKLDSNVSGIYGVSDDFSTIVYQKDDNLYVMKGMEEKEKIASNIYDAYVYDINRSLKIYYIKDSGEENISYYDLIDDDYLAQDQQIEEPRIEDYQRITYKDSFWGVQEKVEVDDSYYEELDKYYEKQSRDYLRSSLENYTMVMSEWKFYYYEDATGDSDEVLTALMRSGETVYGNIGTDTALMYVYNTDQEQMEKIKLSAVENMDLYSDIQQQIDKKISKSMQMWYIENGKMHEIEDYESDGSYTGVWGNEEKHMIYLCHYVSGYNELYGYDYRQKNASLELISDEIAGLVSPPGLIKDTEEICYVNVDEELYYGDRQIDDDVQASSAFWTKDGGILYWTDLDEGEGTLKVYRDGKVTELADDAALIPSMSGFYSIFDSGRIAFLTDYNFKKNRGDLNVYDGNNVKTIDSDVTRIIY